MDVDNVVFVHGSLDPWHAMGRLSDLNENSPAFVINGKFYRIMFYVYLIFNVPTFYHACKVLPIVLI